MKVWQAWAAAGTSVGAREGSFLPGAAGVPTPAGVRGWTDGLWKGQTGSDDQMTGGTLPLGVSSSTFWVTVPYPGLIFHTGLEDRSGGPAQGEVSQSPV